MDIYIYIFGSFWELNLCSLFTANVESFNEKYQKIAISKILSAFKSEPKSVWQAILALESGIRYSNGELMAILFG